VPSPTLDENGLARLTLREIAREHGPAGLDSPYLLGTLLPDLLPGAPRENRLILAAAQLGVAGLLASRMSLGMPVMTAVNDIAARLADETALDAEASRWVVTEYAYVLGHGPDPRTAVDGNPPSGGPANSPVPPRPRADSDPVPVPPISVPPVSVPPVSPAGGPVASPGAPPYVPPVSPTAVMPLPPNPPNRHVGLIVAASVVAVIVITAAVVYGLTRDARKTPTPSGGASSGPCVVGTWTESTEFVRVDKDGNLTDDESGTKLSRTSGSETRVYNADNTGTISLHGMTLEGDTSSGDHVLFFYDETEDGTFHWEWDGSTVTFSDVNLPGTFRVDVNGSTVESDDHVNPLYDNGDASLSCDDDSMVQSGTGYERDYDRG
jgi:hypothetical protein